MKVEKISCQDSEMLGFFTSQTDEMIQIVNTYLKNGEAPTDEEVYEAYRVVHRFKGDAQFLELSVCAKLSSHLIQPLREAYQESHNLPRLERVVIEQGIQLLERRKEDLEAPLSDEERAFLS